MAMSMGGGGGSMADINVTPMIDILLVLLIIFMVIVPVTPKGLDALVPQPPKTPQKDTSIDRTIVVQVFPTISGECATSAPSAPPCYKINEKTVLNGVGGQAGKSELIARLTDIYANRAERVMFVNVNKEYANKVDFRYVAEVIDIGRAAGVDHIGLMTPKILEGQ
jgi:biopolymer transport protein TolR